MIIVGQERKTIINLERINFFNIEEADNNKFNILINYGDDMEGIIATYETEKRAKEVLQEIISAYSDFKYYAAETGKKKTEIGMKIYQNYRSIDLYEMPEK